MLDRFILNIEESHRYALLIPVMIIITIILAIFNRFIGGNSIFLVALISLTLAYPSTKFAHSMERKDIETIAKSRSFFGRYKKEFFLFISIFIGVCIGMLISAPLISDFSYQESFVNKIQGNAISEEIQFKEVLINNLNVILITFIISFLLYSGLIFVLIWNASIIIYYLYNLGSYEKIFYTTLLIVPHGFLEIAGYILAGISGGILSFRIDNAYSSKFYKVYDKQGNIKLKPDRRNTLKKLLNKRFYKEMSILFFLSIVLILLGAIVETI